MRQNLSYKNGESNSDVQAVIFAIVAGGVVIALTAVLTFLLCFRTVPKFEVKNLELGKPVPSKVYNYVTGLPIMHDAIEVDYSQVDNMNEGNYEVVVSGKLEFTCVLHVQDTKAPYIKLLGASDGTNSMINPDSGVYYSAIDDCVILELGEVYNVLDIVDEIGDISDRYQASVNCNGSQISIYKHIDDTNYYESFRTTECGQFVYDITVIDLAGNISTATVNAKVVDTKGPKPILNDSSKYYATDTELGVLDFVTAIEDLSGVARYCFVINGIETDNISYTQIGSYDIAIKTVDNLGNEAVTDFTANFDKAPVFVGVREEILIPVGKEFDFLQYFRAFDNTDGDLSAHICVSSDTLDLSQEGTYPYECWVADSHGISSTYCGTLTVGAEDGRSYSLTPDEIDVLNEYGYFEYQLLEEGNYDAMTELVRPTLVNLLRRYNNGGYCFGSGYVYKVDSDYLYIGTVDHVISDMITDVEIRFCDDDETTITVPVRGYERVDAGSETAMFKIPISSLPVSVLLDIKQVVADEDIYSELSVGQEIVAYSGHWSNTTPTIRKLYIKRLDEKFLDGSMHCIVTSHNTKGGMSGCPIFDLQGRMVALCEGYWGRFNYDIYAYEYEGYQQRIEGLSELYESVKEMPYDEIG